VRNTALALAVKLFRGAEPAAFKGRLPRKLGNFIFST
jgi:hypothetical protein